MALCGALTYAEIGSRYPVTGGYYKIFATAYHPSVAFAINCIILISNAASLAAVALIGSEYLSEIIFANPPSDLVKSFIAMGSILLFYVVNLMGLNEFKNPECTDADQDRNDPVADHGTVFSRKTYSREWPLWRQEVIHLHGICKIIRRCIGRRMFYLWRIPANHQFR